MKLFAGIAFLFCVPFGASAQCSGNVLFSENFGGNSSSPFTGAPLQAGVTTYTFNPSTAVNDGQYSIRKSSADIGTGGPIFGSWHVGNDHTGNGYMMLINADFTSGKFYETTVNNLCSGSQLYFSAWIANLLKAGAPDPLDPIVRFEISSAATGVVLATFTTSSIPRFASFTWTQYGFNFSLPSGESSVILRIFNNQPGGQGNDLCLDDIEFTLCGPVMNPVVSGTYQNTNEICVGGQVTFSGNVATGFYQNPAYQWQYSSDGVLWNNIPGAQATSYNISNVQTGHSGFYRLLNAEAVNINAANCRAISPVKELKVFNSAVLTITGKTNLCAKDTLKLGSSSQALNYSWGNGISVISTSSELLVPDITPLQSGLYTLKVITNGGCISVANTSVNILANNLTKKLPESSLLCDGDQLEIDVSAPPANSFVWNDGSTAFQRTLSLSGTYILQSSDGFCSRLDTLVVETRNSPRLTIALDTLICFSDSVLVDATTADADAYLWNTGNTNAVLALKEKGRYEIIAYNTCGGSIGFINVSVEECSEEVFVPNAFTPNGNGLNDVLKARAFFRLQEFELKLFDRWGKQVFLTNNINNGWDGQIKGNSAPPGTYSWKMTYRRNNRIIQKKGIFVLIR